MATKNKKEVDRGSAFLRKYVKKIKGEEVLVLPESKAEKFLKGFLRTHRACGEGNEYIAKFMKSVFGFQTFEVRVTTLVPAKGSIKVVAKTKEAAMVLAPSKVKDRSETLYLSANERKIAGEVKVSGANVSRY